VSPPSAGRDTVVPSIWAYQSDVEVSGASSMAGLRQEVWPATAGTGDRTRPNRNVAAV